MKGELIRSWLRRGLAELFSTLGTGGSFWFRNAVPAGEDKPDKRGLVTSSRRFPDAEPRAVER
jgi:hypothetical protein